MGAVSGNGGQGGKRKSIPSRLGRKASTEIGQRRLPLVPIVRLGDGHGVVGSPKVAVRNDLPQNGRACSHEHAASILACGRCALNVWLVVVMIPEAPLSPKVRPHRTIDPHWEGTASVSPAAGCIRPWADQAQRLTASCEHLLTKDRFTRLREARAVITHALLQNPLHRVGHVLRTADDVRCDEYQQG